MATLRIDDQVEIPRPDLTIFYVLDRSGSMSGARDAILDVAMENTISALKQVRSTDSHLRIAVLEYDSSARWLTPYPEYIEDFVWRGIASSATSKKPGELSASSGLTNIPAALRELNSKMSKNGFLDLSMGSYMPIVIFMTDGLINDCFEPQLQPALDELAKNRWFKRAAKIGFAIGEGDKDVVIRIVGKEGFTETADLQAFADKLVKVSVTASLIYGSSRTTGSTVPVDSGSSGSSVWGGWSFDPDKPFDWGDSGWERAGSSDEGRDWKTVPISDTWEPAAGTPNPNPWNQGRRIPNDWTAGSGDTVPV